MTRHTWRRSLVVCALIPGAVIAQTSSGVPGAVIPTPALEPERARESVPSAPELQAEAASSEMELFALEDELRTETRIASQRAQTIRETPGVVTIVTREEIISSGSRDLIDVLQQVPGFSFAVDVQNAVGLGFRGAWGHEGKVLLLIDGQEMNENLYSTLQFGGHYPIENIQRIEIIRGPGSAQYGGYAELAVINVITRSAKELNGGAVAAQYGQFPTAFARRTLSLSWAQEVAQVEGLSASVSAWFGQAQRSDGEYRDFSGNSFAMDHNARTDPLFLNVGASYKDLHLRFLFDDHQLRTRDAFGEVMEEPTAMSFRAYTLDARYELEPSDRIRLTPRLNFRRALPWSDDTVGAPLHFVKVVDRLTGSLTLNYRVTDELDLMVGGETYLDHAATEGELTDYNAPFKSGREVNYQNRAVFAEALYAHWIANLIVGARFENHSVVGNSFVPRIALTRVIDRLHVKALFSRAFRAPGIQNINLGPVRPENTTVIEAEAGYQLTDDFFVRANAFDLGIHDPIVYFYDEETDTEGYTNFTRTGTRGVEAELRFRRKGMWANASYSLYVAHQNEVASYRVDGRDDVLLGFPQHKVTLNSGFTVWNKLTVSPSLVFMSERHGFVTGTDGVGELGTVPAAAVLNLFVTYRDLGVRGLEVGLGVRDLLDARPVFLQAYDGGHAPLPGPGREVLARLSYHYSLE